MLEAMRSLLSLSGRMDCRRLLSLGRGFGSAAAWPLQRRLAHNLTSAGVCPTPAIIDRYFQLLGLWAGWSLAIYHKGFVTSEIADRVHMDDSVVHLDRAVAKGNGVILASAHFFCHEIGAAAVNLRHPVTALVRENKDRTRHSVKSQWYRATGLGTVQRPRGASALADTLAYLRILRAGKILAITPDLPMRPERGVPVSMFGKTVILPSGMLTLAMRSGAPIVTARGDWVDDGHHRPSELRVCFDAPIFFSISKDRDAIHSAGMQDWARRQEEHVRRFPADWMFWLDKAWTRVLRASGKKP
jgi:lauroyl/myristoyl acyltransferase